MIDLHTHSRYSDGSLTPAELADAAAGAGLSAVALTDHDTTEGVGEFVTAARGRFRAVPGVEISVDHSPGILHMLGLFIRTGGALEEMLRELRRGREDRNAEIARRLNTIGVPVDLREVIETAGVGIVARPHFAQVLVRHGWAKDAQEAFDRYLAKGRPGYVVRRKMSAVASIRAIRDSGGVAVLAHPVTLGLQPRGLRELVKSLQAEGLGGIEAHYPAHNRVQTRRCLVLARELGLAVAGGSDFHGDFKPQIRIGRGFGTLSVPDECLPDLESRRPPDAGG
jgi:predicted metal-dependent phosphoesterase TrpH